MNNDQNQLRLLSIFHYIVGGLSALFACIPFIHFFLGLAMTSGWLEETEPVADTVGILFMVFAGIFILIGWTFAVLLIFAGHYLAVNRHYMFCLVIAALSCLFFPFGTVLGVFTIIVLNRESVKKLFDTNAKKLKS